jgi:hypothetical protein
MSIQKRDSLYRVRWLEGGRHRQRSFKRAGDAQTFEADIDRSARRGMDDAGLEPATSALSRRRSPS